MSFRDIVPWRWGELGHSSRDNDRSMRSFESQMERLHREMDRVFEDMWTGRNHAGLFGELRERSAFLPQIDETEDDKAYYVSVDLPGMDEKDVHVTVSDRVLTIRGEKKEDVEDKDKDCYRRERSYGSFRRMLELPGEVDQSGIDAAFRKGVLKITLPKTKEAQEKVRHIPVQAA